MISLQFIWLVKYNLYLIGFVAHAISIYAIHSYAPFSKEALLLLKLSVVELAGMIFALSGDWSHVTYLGCHSEHYNSKEYVRDFVVKNHRTAHDKCNNFLFRMISSELALTMTLINLDRLFLACSPIYYDRYLKMWRMKLLCIGSLVLSIVNSAVFSYTPEVDSAFDYEAIIALTTFSLLFMATCIVVAVKFVTSYNLSGSRYVIVNKRQKPSCMNEFLVSFLVSLTYIAFYCIPAPLYLLHVRDMKAEENSVLIYEGIEAGYLLVYVLHPLLCIALIKEFRNKVVNQCFSTSNSETAAREKDTNRASVRSCMTDISLHMERGIYTLLKDAAELPVARKLNQIHARNI